MGPPARRQARPDGDRDRRQRAQGRRARHVHDGREPVPLGPERQQGPQGAGRAGVPRGAGHLPHRDGRVRRRRAARRRRSWRRTGRTRTPTGACRSAARCSTRRARRDRTGRSSARSRPGSGCRWSTSPSATCSTRWSRSRPPTPAWSTTTSAPAGKLYPNADPEHSDGTVVLFGESFATDDGKAHLVPAEWMPAKELPDEEYPFVLNTGRLLEHWHTGSMTRRSFALDAIQPTAMVFVSEADAARMGIADGDFVRVTLAPRLDRAGREGLAPGDAGLVLHPVPLPRGGREPAHDRRDRPGRQDPGVQVLRRQDRDDRPRADRTARLRAGAAGSRLMAEGNGRVPGVEARAGKFPGPSLIPPLTAIQREHGWLPREELVEAVARLAPAAVRDRGDRSRSTRTSAPRRPSRSRSRSAATSRAGSRASAPRSPTARRCTRSRASGAATRRRWRSSRSAIRRCAAARAGGRTIRTRARTSTTGVYRSVRRRSRAGARRVRPEGDGRRRLPDGQEVGDGPRPGGPDQVRGLQRRRGRAGHVQGPPDPRRAAAPRDRGHADRDARDRRAAGLGVHPARVRARGAGAARGDRARARRRACSRTSRSTCSPRRAATSWARRPRCWSAWRAIAASRATSRRSRAGTACTAGRR